MRSIAAPFTHPIGISITLTHDLVYSSGVFTGLLEEELAWCRSQNRTDNKRLLRVLQRRAEIPSAAQDGSRRVVEMASLGIDMQDAFLAGKVHQVQEEHLQQLLDAMHIKCRQAHMGNCLPSYCSCS